MIVWFIFGAMCMLVVLLIVAYLKFSSLNNQAQKAWQQLDHQLKFRTELIPNVALSAASVTSLDRDFVYHLSALKKPLSPQAPLKDRCAYEAQISQAFEKVFQAATHQADLAQEEHFSKLKHSIQQAEKNILRAKKKYNSTAHTFNLMTSLIPLNLIAYMFEMTPYDYFDFDPSLPL